MQYNEDKTDANLTIQMIRLILRKSLMGNIYDKILPDSANRMISKYNNLN